MNAASEDRKPVASFEFSKDISVVVPFLGTTLAVAYDVGYFSSFNINFFSFFTLSEHIVFALQALPAALPIAIGIGWTAYRARSADSALTLLTIVPLFLGCLVVLCVAWYFTTNVAYHEVEIAIVVSIFFQSLLFQTNNLPLRIGFGFVAAIAAASAIGLANGYDYLHLPTRGTIETTIETKNAGKLKGRVIRSRCRHTGLT
jgi:hypothetical protein